MEPKIIIRGAKVNNLKNIDIDIPREKLVVLTGLSGSGKSSLARDTIYAESKRRYIESLSSYIKQFIGVMSKPDVERIKGLPPAIFIDQKRPFRNPRSTVGTMTEIYDYLRLLFARAGKAHCSKCRRELSSQSIKEIINQILSSPQGTRVLILAPRGRSNFLSEKIGPVPILEDIHEHGFARVRVDGKIFETKEARSLGLKKRSALGQRLGSASDRRGAKRHSIEIVIDELELEGDTLIRERLLDSVQMGLKFGEGELIVEADRSPSQTFSTGLRCNKCGISFPSLQPKLFSFNNPYGACPDCKGLGVIMKVDPELLIPNEALSISEGAIRPWRLTTRRNSKYANLARIAKIYKFSLKVPVKKLSRSALDLILYGNSTFKGVIPILEKEYNITDSHYKRSEIENYMTEEICPLCKGRRLNKFACGVKVKGLGVAEVTQMNVIELKYFFNDLLKSRNFTVERSKVISPIVRETLTRLKDLQDVGLDYLTLARGIDSLGGGELQRIRLAREFGSELTGILYILDEPSIGLHPRDIKRLINILKGLRDQGNTVLVVEHDEEIIRAADWLIDIGPGAGKSGGRIVFQGPPREIEKTHALTGLYLAGTKKIPFPDRTRSGSDKDLVIKQASHNNLKNIDVSIPLGKFICVTGVSGSGKSSLIDDILAKALGRRFHRKKVSPGKHQAIQGTEFLNKVITIDQSPIGRTPRSNPATYSGVFTYIRDLFAQVPQAKVRGFTPSHFSFNTKLGKCEACLGEGFKRIEMNFLADVYVTCEECQGKRFNDEALEIEYKGKNISEVLEMSVDAALKFFGSHSSLRQKLRVLCEVGLGYIKLGQPANTLSGGEAQRIKLATELARPQKSGRTLYILDEPTTGLHFDDVSKLLRVLNRLVDKANTVVVIEHNPEVVKCADWIIDLGPEGGDKGGYIVAEGSPRQVARVAKSYTGQFLKKML